MTGWRPSARRRRCKPPRYCWQLVCILPRLSSNIVADRGWLSWQHYRCNRDCKTDPENCFSETLIKRTADLMVSEGFKDAGYTYVNM